MHAQANLRIRNPAFANMMMLLQTSLSFPLRTLHSHPSSIHSLLILLLPTRALSIRWRIITEIQLTPRTTMLAVDMVHQGRFSYQIRQIFIIVLLLPRAEFFAKD